MPKEIYKKYFATCCLITIVCIIILVIYPSHDCVSQTKEISYKDFQNTLNTDNVSSVYLSDGQSFFIWTDLDNIPYKTINPDSSEFKTGLLNKGINVYPYIESNAYKTDLLAANICSFSIFACVLLGCFFMVKAFDIDTGNVDASFKEFPKAKSKTLDKLKQPSDIGEQNPSDKVTFDDIAGHPEVKEDVKILVDFLKNPQKYRDAGAELPKGAIFYGAPGNGKTMFAKAIASEADVSFFYASASSFINTYVGTGAKNVRTLFDKAKSNSPCVIFIDELDAVGGNRINADTNGEEKKTIDELLTQMDGFSKMQNILVIGATNLLDSLDPALLRRFQLHYAVPNPRTVEERIDILRVHAKNKSFTEDVDFTKIAKETTGFSGANLADFLNDAAICQVKYGKKAIDSQCIEEAFIKAALNGHIKNNTSSRDKNELKLVAYHESGHALVGKLLGQEVTSVTIRETTTGAGGFTFNIPKEGLQSKKELEDTIMALYGGRAAEAILFSKTDLITTGASNDIERAHEIIKKMVRKLGMGGSDFGWATYSMDDAKVPESILEEEKRISNILIDKTITLLSDNKVKLVKLATALEEKETLTGEEIDKLIA